MRLKWLDPINQRVSSALAWFSRRFPRSAKFLGIIRSRRRPIAILVVLIFHIVGFFLSINAVMQTRTEQGAVAWAISLNTIPVIAVPAYGIFGDSNIKTYLSVRKAGLEKTRPFAEQLIEDMASASASSQSTGTLMQTFETLASMPAMTGNDVRLLIDGRNTFDSIFKAIEEAEDYILVQFYILRADELGNELKERLQAKTREGVRVYVLTDDIGSLHLSSSYLEELREVGIEAHEFMDTTGDQNRFQLNFRNHRKIVVVDGKVAFLGGHNVGDEYLGKHPTLTPWRDSHIRLEGPIAKSIQIPFVEDWHWATGEVLDDLDWSIDENDFVGEMEALCLPTGPADPMETCAMFFLTAINQASDRIWISTPYFVPDEQMVTALKLAAIRGVDVKVIMPKMFDSQLVYYSSFSYLQELTEAGVQLYAFEEGFLHQKVLLVDDEISAVGSANFDNRSFRLNFEVTGIVSDRGFNQEVAEMLEDDLAKSTPLTAEDYTEKPYYFRLTSRLARLLAPIQ